MIQTKRLSRRHVAAVLIAAFAGWIVGSHANRFELVAWPQASHLKPTGYPQLISTQPLPEMGEMCVVETASLQGGPAPLRAASSPAVSSNLNTKDADRSPVRVIRDTYPTYS